MEEIGMRRMKCRDWKPSPVVALATSPDGSQVAAGREDSTVEIWLVSPGSVGWNCQLTIHGNPNSRISSLAWCRPLGLSSRLFSSSIDGSISEWDLLAIQQKVIVDWIGVSVWQIAAECPEEPSHSRNHSESRINNIIPDGAIDYRARNSDNEEGSDDESNSSTGNDTNTSHIRQAHNYHQRLAFGCDDGCVRICTLCDSDEPIDTIVSLPRVDGRILSVAWGHDSRSIFYGSSNGFIRCWNTAAAFEVYRITIGDVDLSSRGVCIWSLLVLRNGTLVSGDSTGSVSFWDCQHGALIQTYSRHEGDVNALATSPSNRSVFSAGSDGQVIQYKLSPVSPGLHGNVSLNPMEKWVNIGYVRAHTHDVRALTIAVPIRGEDPFPVGEKDELQRKRRALESFMSSDCRRWAHLGVPMLISGGDDAKLFAYSANGFNKFSPHDICPAPQRQLIQFVNDSVIWGTDAILVQNHGWLDVMPVLTQSNVKSVNRKHLDCMTATSKMLATVKCKKSRKIICSAISGNGVLVAFSDQIKPTLVQLKKLTRSGEQNELSAEKMQLPQKLPFAHCLAFSKDSSRLFIAGNDRKIYVVDVATSMIVHVFVPGRDDNSSGVPEPPITRLLTSCDGQWLAAINCYGDIYIFNLEINRRHWFIPRFNGASVTAGGFPPGECNILVIVTSSNHLYALDVDARQLGEWSKRNAFILPTRFQEFPGEVIGLTFPPIKSNSVIIYSARAMCTIDFGKPGEQVERISNTLSLATNNLESAQMNDIKKRKHSGSQPKQSHATRTNFEVHAFENLTLFVGHSSDGSLVTIEKPWMEVVQSLGAPVHRHIYGS